MTTGTMQGRIVNIDLKTNLGVAAAQNVGITLARERGAKYVVLFDHDSIPAPDMILRLLTAAQSQPLVAAVGPCYLDPRRTIPVPFIRIEGLKLVRATCQDTVSVVPVDYLISSGCLIPMSVLDEVGVMREDLFIDYIDIEWGLRARSHGFQCYGVCGANMEHNLGDKPIIVLGKQFPSHSPLRHYYHFRNAVCLYRQFWIPINWKIVDGWRLLLRYGFYTLFAKPRSKHLKMMTLGLWHGLIGRMGPLRDSR